VLGSSTGLATATFSSPILRLSKQVDICCASSVIPTGPATDAVPPPLIGPLASASASPSAPRSLGSLGKPVFATEFGGREKDGPLAKAETEIRIGHWAGLVAGHTVAPFCWWHQWVDQTETYAPTAPSLPWLLARTCAAAKPAAYT